MNLPAEFIEFARKNEKLDTPLTCEFPSWLVLWPLDQIDQYNRECEASRYAPGFTCFGSNGSGELLAFDENRAVVCLPAIGMEPKYATPVADSWKEFQQFISNHN